MTDMPRNRDGSHLADTVLDWANADVGLSEDAKLVILAALEGDDSLAAALSGACFGDIRQVQSSPDTPKVEPAGAFLKSINVRGFRGIGPEADLDLLPAPGLTIVAGRNGSGKSSFSEALELALTGNTYRWRNKKAAVWSEHWRNIHEGIPCRLRIELAEEGAGTTTIGVDWTEGATLTERQTWVQRHDKPRETGVSGLGWDRAIELYQPILSYDELGGVLDQGPSKLFDKIDAILGVEQATDAERRLADALKVLQEPDKIAKPRRVNSRKYSPHSTTSGRHARSICCANTGRTSTPSKQSLLGSHLSRSVSLLSSGR